MVAITLSCWDFYWLRNEVSRIMFLTVIVLSLGILQR